MSQGTICWDTPASPDPTPTTEGLTSDYVPWHVHVVEVPKRLFPYRPHPTSDLPSLLETQIVELRDPRLKRELPNDSVYQTVRKLRSFPKLASVFYDRSRDPRLADPVLLINNKSDSSSDEDWYYKKVEGKPKRLKIRIHLKRLKWLAQDPSTERKLPKAVQIAEIGAEPSPSSTDTEPSIKKPSRDKGEKDHLHVPDVKDDRSLEEGEVEDDSKPPSVVGAPTLDKTQQKENLHSNKEAVSQPDVNIEKVKEKLEEEVGKEKKKDKRSRSRSRSSSSETEKKSKKHKKKKQKKVKHKKDEKREKRKSSSPIPDGEPKSKVPKVSDDKSGPSDVTKSTKEKVPLIHEVKIEPPDTPPQAPQPQSPVKTHQPKPKVSAPEPREAPRPTAATPSVNGHIASAVPESQSSSSKPSVQGVPPPKKLESFSATPKLKSLSSFVHKMCEKVNPRISKEIDDIVKESQKEVVDTLNKMVEGKPYPQPTFEPKWRHFPPLSMSTQLHASMLSNPTVQRIVSEEMMLWMKEKPLDMFLLGKQTEHFKWANNNNLAIKASPRTDDTVRQCQEEFKADIYELMREKKLIGGDSTSNSSNGLPKPKCQTDETVHQVYRQVSQYLEFLASKGVGPASTAQKEETEGQEKQLKEEDGSASPSKKDKSKSDKKDKKSDKDKEKSKKEKHKKKDKEKREEKSGKEERSSKEKSKEKDAKKEAKKGRWDSSSKTPSDKKTSSSSEGAKAKVVHVKNVKDSSKPKVPLSLYDPHEPTDEDHDTATKNDSPIPYQLNTPIMEGFKKTPVDLRSAEEKHKHEGSRRSVSSSPQKHKLSVPTSPVKQKIDIRKLRASVKDACQTTVLDPLAETLKPNFDPKFDPLRVKFEKTVGNPWEVQFYYQKKYKEYVKFRKEEKFPLGSMTAHESESETNFAWALELALSKMKVQLKQQEAKEREEAAKAEAKRAKEAAAAEEKRVREEEAKRAREMAAQVAKKAKEAKEAAAAEEIRKATEEAKRKAVAAAAAVEAQIAAQEAKTFEEAKAAEKAAEEAKKAEAAKKAEEAKAAEALKVQAISVKQDMFEDDVNEYGTSSSQTIQVPVSVPALVPPVGEKLISKPEEKSPQPLAAQPAAQAESKSPEPQSTTKSPEPTATTKPSTPPSARMKSFTLTSTKPKTTTTSSKPGIVKPKIAKSQNWLTRAFQQAVEAKKKLESHASSTSKGKLSALQKMSALQKIQMAKKPAEKEEEEKEAAEGEPEAKRAMLTPDSDKSPGPWEKSPTPAAGATTTGLAISATQQEVAMDTTSPAPPATTTVVTTSESYTPQPSWTPVTMVTSGGVTETSPTATNGEGAVKKTLFRHSFTGTSLTPKLRERKFSNEPAPEPTPQHTVQHLQERRDSQSLDPNSQDIDFGEVLEMPLERSPVRVPAVPKSSPPPSSPEMQNVQTVHSVSQDVPPQPTPSEAESMLGHIPLPETPPQDDVETTVATFEAEAVTYTQDPAAQYYAQQAAEYSQQASGSEGGESGYPGYNQGGEQGMDNQYNYQQQAGWWGQQQHQPQWHWDPTSQQWVDYSQYYQQWNQQPPQYPHPHWNQGPPYMDQQQQWGGWQQHNQQSWEGWQQQQQQPPPQQQQSSEEQQSSENAPSSPGQGGAQQQGSQEEEYDENAEEGYATDEPQTSQAPAGHELYGQYYYQQQQEAGQQTQSSDQPQQQQQQQQGQQQPPDWGQRGPHGNFNRPQMPFGRPPFRGPPPFGNRFGRPPFDPNFRGPRPRFDPRADPRFMWRPNTPPGFGLWRKIELAPGTDPNESPAKHIRMFVFNRDESICKSIMRFLDFMGAKDFDPYNVSLLKAVGDVEINVYIHTSDILKMHNIPNLLRLKENQKVKFVMYENVFDVKHRKYNHILVKGGILVPDDQILLEINPDNLRSICEFMLERKKEAEEPWCMKVYSSMFQRISKIKTACVPCDPNLLRLEKIEEMLRHYQDQGVVDVLPAAEAELVVKPAPEYTRTLVQLQADACWQHRHIFFVTNMPASCIEATALQSQGIAVINPSMFIKFIAGKDPSKDMQPQYFNAAGSPASRLAGMEPTVKLPPFLYNYGLRGSPMFSDLYRSSAVDVISVDMEGLLASDPTSPQASRGGSPTNPHHGGATTPPATTSHPPSLLGTPPVSVPPMMNP